MAEDKNTLLNTLAEPISNATKNVIDKPTQNVGTTLADIWYLVFGGISQAAEKRKIKYSYALQEFEKELKEKISKIPEDKLSEPDIQVVAPALEASKYCILHSELRELFSNLISNSMSKENYKNVHPSFASIICQMTPLDAKNITIISQEKYHPICNYIVNYKNGSYTDYYKNIFLSNKCEPDLTLQSISMSSLERLGLIEIKFGERLREDIYESFETTELYLKLQSDLKNNNIVRATSTEIRKGVVELTPYGKLFVKSCVK